MAGGKGTRLAEFTREVPKPMLKIGDRPLLQHQVELLAAYGIKDIIILVNHQKNAIMDYFGKGDSLDARIRYFEETTPLGTVGGIKEIETWLDDTFIVLYGDVMINMELNRLIAFHQRHKSECTLVLHPNNHPFDSDLVEIDETGRVIDFHPKPHPPEWLYRNLVNAGAYVFSRKILQFIEKGKKADFGRQIFPAIYKDIRMFGYNTAEYLKDMGTPERFRQVNEDWASGKIAGASCKHPKKAIFLDRDGVLNVEKSFISRPEELQLYDFTPDAVRRINEFGYLSVVVTNQSAIARNLCTIEELGTIHKKLETELGNKGAWLDAIYFCPHHPDKGFPEENPEYKIDCECRKPKTGMFIKAAEKFNIDFSGSFMIGDSERDIKAGIATGCVTIGVRTGYGIRKTRVMPDFFFENLKEAVDFILDEPYLSLFNGMVEKSRLTHKKPYIISIAGNARAGKSVLSSYLQYKFRQQGYHPLKIELDHWILPAEKREHCKNVYDRFQLEKMTADLKQLIAGEPVQLSAYANHPERQSYPLEYTVKGHDVLILDGIVALSHDFLRRLSDFRIFMEIPEDAFRERFIQYYRWRGMREADALQLMEKRKSDEYLLIEKERKFADIVINPFST